MAVAFEQKPHPSDELAAALAGTCQNYLTIANRGEDVRCRDDRIGARLWHGQHYVGVRQNPDRSAIVANVVMSLVHHKVSIMVKQEPVPIVEASEEGDKDAAELMRAVVIQVSKDVKLDEKARNCEILANCTRTSALKWFWDKSKNGGIGGIGCYIVPGWNLILDNRCSSKDAMMFCGDRATMTRSQAMEQYPEASDEILEGRGGAYRRGQTMDANKTPVKDPWGGGSGASKGAPTSINGKPVFTAYAGDPGFSVNQDETVELCEEYHMDLTMYEDEEEEKDSHGNTVHDIATTEDGEPLFTEMPQEMLHGAMVPVYQLIKAPRIRTVLKRKYPHWRRTTMLMPDAKVIEDIAWDGPLPYAFFDDTYPMTGVWARGSALQLETMQAMTNVGLSIMTDNLRMGSVQAFLSDPSNGLMHKVLVPGPGQVIPAAPGSLQGLEVPKLDANWFAFINQLVSLMERIYGAQGIMQGEAAGRVDSAAGYDMLAEIGGSRIVECTQRMESSLADCARIIGWFAQNYFTEEHAVGVEGKDGEAPTMERAWGPLLKGSFRYDIEVGSTLAWSESAKYQRYLGMFRDGAIDRVEFYKRVGMSGWQEMVKRMEADMASGKTWMMTPAGAKPPKPPKPTPSHTQSARGGAARPMIGA